MSREIVQSDVFDALPALETDSAHAAIVDFPWKFDASNGTGRMAEGRQVDSLDYDVTDHSLLGDVLEELARVLVPGAWVFVHADDEVQPEFRGLVEDSALTYRRTLAWDQKHIGMGWYHRVQHYPVIAATNGETERYVKGRGTVFEAASVSRSVDYATPKPPELARQLLAPPVMEGHEKLLEPFCGTAPGAAAHSGPYWGADIRPKAIRLGRDNMNQAQLDVATDGGVDQ